MPTEMKPKQNPLMRRARQAAQAAGKKWSELTPEERRKYRSAAVQRGSNNKGASEMRASAKRAAQAAGETWNALSKEQRREYLKRARQKA